LGRQVRENWLDGSDTVTHATVTSYDAAGQVVGVSDPGASYQYTYDRDGRLSASGMVPGDSAVTTSSIGYIGSLFPESHYVEPVLLEAYGVNTVLSINLASTEFDA
jgi:YD repeat-containing protein